MLYTIIDNGKTRGFTVPAKYLSREQIEDMIEEIEASNPKFLKSLEESRNSGPAIPWAEVKKQLDIDI